MRFSIPLRSKSKDCVVLSCNALNYFYIDCMPGPPEEFQKIIKDFINDITSTFPEYEPIINRWWKLKDYSHIENETDRLVEITKNNEERMDYIFKYCLSVFPERFFEILYQNNNLFSDNNNTNTEFLPGISFKYLMNCDISESTRETIWKYLQLIMMSLASSVKNNTAFSETAKLFDSLNKEEFKDKLEETMEKMQEIFEHRDLVTQGLGEGEGECESLKENEHEHNENKDKDKDNQNKNINNISNMLNGKLGDLAREIAEETAGNMNLDMENITNTQDVFKNLFKNPAKLMELVSSVGTKLENRIKSGDISEKELFSEASDIMNNMKNMPGMENIQSMMKQMGMNANMKTNNLNPNIDTNVMKKQIQLEKMKERINKRQPHPQQTQTQTQYNALTDEQLFSVFENDVKKSKEQNKGKGKEKK